MLGNKLVKLRKENKLSQDSLADKLGITRQTISNWELNITKPDIVQIKNISEIFNISIDELLDNNTKDIIEKKISNTEKLTNKTNKYIKITLITLITLYFIILIFLIIITIYFFNKKDFTNDYQTSFRCNNNKIIYDVSIDNYYNSENGNTSFDIVVFKCNDADGKCNYERFNAGSTIEEALKSLNTIKKIIIDQGATCK
ncbi:MAG: helix-turn-helix transcriptional regulator [Bacilli bacterium]|jgi:transcriptional regulator with XRE-family HTH domain